MEIDEKCKQLLRLWISHENGEGHYKLTGAYWEVLLPILEKYAPDELEVYSQYVGEDFDLQNLQVKQTVDKGIEDTNYRNAIKYLNHRMDSYATPQDPHYVDLGDDNIVAYIPNQAIQDQPEFE